MQGLQEASDFQEIIEVNMHEDKNMLLSVQREQTDKDTKEIPFLKNIEETISALRHKVKNNMLPSKDKMMLSQIVVELEVEKFMVKDAYTKPFSCATYTKPTSKHCYDGDTGYYVIENGEEKFHLVSQNYIDFTNPKVWCELIKFYSPLKEMAWEELDNDLHWIITIFEEVVDAVKDTYPVFFDMLCWRVDKLTNREITILINQKYELNKNEQFTWKILTKTFPSILASEYKRRWVISTYNKPYFLFGWKKCNNCGKIKPKTPLFWTRNSGSDGYYSICKDCRNRPLYRNQKYTRLREGFNENAAVTQLLEEKENRKKKRGADKD